MNQTQNLTKTFHNKTESDHGFIGREKTAQINQAKSRRASCETEVAKTKMLRAPVVETKP